MSATTRTRGLSLAKGPVAIVGIVGIAMGVAGLLFAGHSFSVANIPHGAIHGNTWLGIELNGWTNLLFIAAGLLLLLGASMHWSAKTSAFVVAGVLGAAAVIALIRGNGICGIFAANHRTEIIWGAAAIVLLVLAMLPRVGDGGRSRAAREPVDRDAGVRDEPIVRDEPVARRVTRDEPVARDEPVTRDEPVARRESVARSESGRDRWTVAEDRDAGDERLTREEAADRDDPARREAYARREQSPADPPTDAV
jgi:hypothetical protein